MIMINELIENAENLLATSICNNWDHATVSVTYLRQLVEASKLLLDVHEMADSGELDGVDLDWIVKVDAMVLGDNAASDVQSDAKGQE